MAAFEYWTHGVAVQVEPPAGITVTPTRYGFGTKLYASGKGGCWLHLAIPTPQAPDTESWALECTHIHVRARRSGTVQISSIHLWQGGVRAYANDAIAWALSTTESTHTLVLSAQQAFSATGPLVVCLRGEWEAAGELWIVGAGLRLREVAS